MTDNATVRQGYTYGDDNRRQQADRWTRGRAFWRQMVIDKREAQVRRLTGASPATRTGLLGWLYHHILRVVAMVSPTTRRLERERRVAQEMRHSRLSRSKYSPGTHQRRAFNARRSG